ncbi:MAG: thioredoxin domain-containing protein [Candidatus Jorgensenbacteria bacterium]
MEPVNEKPKRDYLLPASVLLSALIVSLALVYNAGKRVGDGTDRQLGANVVASVSAALEKVRAVDAADHLRGAKDAPIVVVGFSDLECPFCKTFHETLRQAVESYSGQVAWVYRHFPLDELHSKARNEAEATECAGALGGNEKFWAYIDRLFATTPSNNQLVQAELPRIAEYVGLPKESFASCLSGGKYAARIQTDEKEAVAAGGRGTPYSVLLLRNAASADAKNFITTTNDEIAQQLPLGSPPTFAVSPDGTRVSMNGALPSGLVKQVFDKLLNR